MTKQEFFDNLASFSSETLCVDALIKSVRRDLQHGNISEAAAIYSLRGAGVSEPEISEVLDQERGDQ